MFDVFGLREGVLLMADRQTRSVWTHLDGLATEGPKRGTRIRILPALHTTWDEWLSLYPETSVLSEDTPFKARYHDVQLGLPNPEVARSLMHLDARLREEELVLGVTVNAAYRAYPLSVLASSGAVVNDSLGGVPVVVFFDARASSAGAFSRMVRGAETTFESVAGPTLRARDRLTGTVWNFAGRGLSGALQGTSLAFVTSYVSEWYGWSAYHPRTDIYRRP